MSKRGSRSAEFIGRFEYLDKNKIGIEQHVSRWMANYARWLDQLERLHRKRNHVLLELTSPTQGVPHSVAGPAVRPGEKLLLKLDQHALELMERMDSVEAKCTDVGLPQALRPLRGRARLARNAIKSDWERDKRGPLGRHLRTRASELHPGRLSSRRRGRRASK